jgi:hypothetical protein
MHHGVLDLLSDDRYTALAGLVRGVRERLVPPRAGE